MELVKYDAACRALAEARVAGFSHLRAHGAISDSSAETVVAETGANCCFSDSTLRHHLAARSSTAQPLPQLKVQRSSKRCRPHGRP
jgi:hypothetical protein